MPKVFVKPAVPGQVVRNPENMRHVLSDEGEFVEHTVLWERKIMQGDVLVSEPPQANKQAAKQSKPVKEGE